MHRTGSRAGNTNPAEPDRTGEQITPEMVVNRIREVISDPGLDLEDPRIAQELLGAGIKLLGQHADEGSIVRPYPEDAQITSSEVAIATSLMLETAGVEIFELAMWQIWAVRSQASASESEISEASPRKGVKSVD